MEVGKPKERCVTTMNPKERLTAVLQHHEVDRPPVICPGGMMNAAVVEIWSRQPSGCLQPIPTKT